MKILVTGSSGFIGSRVARALKELGHEVDGVDKKRGEHTNLVQDIFDTDCSKYDVVHHFAGPKSVPHSMDDPQYYYHQIVDGTNHLLKSCNGLFIFYSTIGVGEGTTPYHMAKELAERNVKRKKEWIIRRIANVWGAEESGSVVDIFRAGGTEIFGDGKQTRDFVHIDDVVEICCLNDTPGFIYYIGTGMPTRIIDLFKLINPAKEPEFKPPRSYEIQNPSIKTSYPLHIKKVIKLEAGSK